ncbi:MAG: 16S rRNA (cytosine(967)-C(5))-methyltransferase RsmB [Longimicrobiales bacterium]
MPGGAHAATRNRRAILAAARDAVLTQTTGATPARLAAFDILRAVRKGELADRALARVLPGVPPRERAFAQELTYGVLRMRGRLDYRISRIATRPLGEIQPDALDALRMGAYQLFELNGIPPYAAVSESVELVKPGGTAVAGFVNGVLKGMQRAGSPAFPSLDQDAVTHLTTWGSHPQWLVERWIRQYGAEDTAWLVEANNRRPEVIIQPFSMTTTESVRVLSGEPEMTAEALQFHAKGIRLTHGDVTRALELVPGIVQDPAARFVTRYIGAKPKDTVLDVCAAPGGKAVGLAQRAGYTVAADLSLQRLGRVHENVERLRGQGVPINAGLVVADARTPPFREADIVFVDAPCTGTGTLRRHPDGRWRLQHSDLRALVTLQREILLAAAACVQPGGILVYATCSLEPEENAQQVEWLLQNIEGFAVAPPSDFPLRLDRRGFLHVLPQEHGFDGAFAARLRRIR